MHLRAGIRPDQLLGERVDFENPTGAFIALIVEQEQIFIRQEN